MNNMENLNEHGNAIIIYEYGVINEYNISNYEIDDGSLIIYKNASKKVYGLKNCIKVIVDKKVVYRGNLMIMGISAKKIIFIYITIFIAILIYSSL